MRLGWRPERRNRKIGTSDSGFKHRNKFDIPRKTAWSDRHGFEIQFYEDLNPVYTEKYNFHDIDSESFETTIMYEKPHEGWSYGCTPNDVIRILGHLMDDEEVPLLSFIVFRQPTIKQDTLMPVWGRLLYSFFTPNDVGNAIMLEAVDLDKPIIWSKKQDVESMKEMDRLQQDGHEISSDKRSLYIHKTEESVRGTLLYRTLLHELGHAVHHNQCFESGDDKVMDAALDRYHSIPRREKEDFAHRYAEETAIRLRKMNAIPFDPMGFSDEQIEKMEARK